MAKIIQFNPKKRPSRQQALQWLSQNYEIFPNFGMTVICSIEIFNGYRFTVGVDGEMYFANGIYPGITEKELIEFKNANRTIPE